MLPTVTPLMENCSKAGEPATTEVTQAESTYWVLGLMATVWHQTFWLGTPAPFTTIILPAPEVWSSQGEKPGWSSCGLAMTS